MTNWHYNKSFNNGFHEVFSYDKNPIMDLFAKYYKKDISDEDIMCDGFYSKLDSLLLYSMIREKKFKNILEIGGGGTTNIILQALRKNKSLSTLTNHSLELQNSIHDIPDHVECSFFQGDLMDTFENNPTDLDQIDFCFIDGSHHAYFAIFYFYEILRKLPTGTIIHIHDIQNPEVLQSEHDAGHIPLHPVYCPHPTPTDEIYALYFLIKEHKQEFKVICNTNDLLYNEIDNLKYIQGVERGMYRHGGVTAPAESLWLERV
tara:strand:+ start:6780 stop:7562 length:783 start_codon:yes stop_codon:yes gene_type:complete